jgi:CheY-like chemotaxis protein
MHILIIEDNATNLELMQYLLCSFGHTVEGIDGQEVARRLRADPATRTLPLVAVTALAMVGDQQRVLAAGFDGYVPKPLNPETFVRQIEAFLPK